MKAKNDPTVWKVVAGLLIAAILVIFVLTILQRVSWLVFWIAVVMLGYLPIQVMRRFRKP